MSDNSTLPATGEAIRDKDRSSVKTQIVGLDLGIGGGTEILQTAAALADGTSNPTIPGWASMGMVFNGSTWDRLRGDTTYGVAVSPRARRLRSSVASSGLTTTSPAYAIGDTAGAQYTFTGAARSAGGTGVIEAVGLLDKGDVGVDYRVHIYRASVTLAADNNAWAVSDSDQDSWITSVTMPSMIDVGANRTAYSLVGSPYDCAATSLFVGVETRTANAVYTAATDLVLMLYLALD